MEKVKEEKQKDDKQGKEQRKGPGSKACRMRVKIVDPDGTPASKTLHNNLVKKDAGVQFWTAKHVVKGRDLCVCMALKAAPWLVTIGSAG